MDKDLLAVFNLRMTPEVQNLVDELDKMADSDPPTDLINQFHAVLLEQGNPLLIAEPRLTRMFATVMTQGFVLGISIAKAENKVN